MNNSNFDPDRVHQRRLIINSSIIVLVLILALAGWLHISHYHRTPTDKQQAIYLFSFLHFLPPQKRCQ